MLVGGVGIFTIMTIAVRERTAEIGLLQAVGAHRNQIRNVFLGESLILAAVGAVAGILQALVIIVVLRLAIPGLPVSAAWAYIGAAVLVAALIGLLAGVLRGEMIDEGKSEVAVVTVQNLRRAKAIYVGNSLRGLIRGRLA